MANDDWPRIAIVGAGAFGCYFGGMLALAGAPVTFIGRELQVEALRTNGLTLESVLFKRTEIDSLNGYVARLGDELCIPTPVNRTLHALVKLLEEDFS